MKFVRILLLPLSILYGCIVFFRNKLYDWGIFLTTEFEIPIISVGNLTVGGTGKTPHIEYLIRLLQPEFRIATLSRGYGRKSKGFVLSTDQSTALDIGDEPMQFRTKYDKLPVAVDNKRVRGIKKLMQDHPSLQTVLLDDAFQHRAVKPGISIVLTDFSKLYLNDYMVPSGSLREFKAGVHRADIIIVSKCPEILLPIERKRLIKELNPLPYQRVYFSYIRYGNFIPFNVDKTNPFAKEYYFERHFSIVLLTGIANTRALEYYLKDKLKITNSVKFPDHHPFTKNDLEMVLTLFNSISSVNKMILTTEKDFMRLKNPELYEVLKNVPIFYIPIEIDFHDKDKDEFNEQILHYVRTNQKYRSNHSK